MTYLRSLRRGRVTQTPGSGRNRWVLLALIPLLSCLPPAGAHAEEPALLVFAAASLQQALDAAIAARPDGASVKAAYGSSSTLARQIEQGAQPDLFISANVAWMDYLEARGLLRSSTRANLVGNALVLIAPAASDARIDIAPGFDLAGALRGGRLAIGDPDHVPAGHYGRQALEHHGVWQAVSDRLARAGNARAALALVSSGEAPFGIVYRSDAMAEARVRVVGRFPPVSHAPIVYPLAITASSSHPAAEAFAAWLSSAPVSWLFARHGFSPLR